MSVDIYRNTGIKDIPPHFYWGALELDYSTAIEANVDLQNFTVMPRRWYVDARFRCADCGTEFLWSAKEQQVWFETYRFFVDSLRTRCDKCCLRRSEVLHLRQEYDALIGEARSQGTVEQKKRILEILEKLESSCGPLPDKMSEARDLFCKQLMKLSGESDH
ncbi:MAG: zinc-ribbon domain containing protein [Verrucomicrobia bacterium]|nr:zinc-ribbon domain containing protein [Verrucomicrobiota bacterium]